MPPAATRILGAGHKAQPAGYRNAIRDYPQFMLLYVRAGELVVDGAARGPGAWVVLPPGVAVDLASPRGGYRGCFIEAHPADCALAPRVHQGMADGDLESALAAALAELDHGVDDGLLAALWAVLLLRTLRRCPAMQAVDPRDPVEQAKRLLAAHVYTTATVEGILAAVPLSPRHLGRLFRAREGCSPKRWLLARKIGEARKRLVLPGISVTQVALDLGFPSSQHFATTFHRLTGRTPSACRRAP